MDSNISKSIFEKIYAIDQESQIWYKKIRAMFTMLDYLMEDLLAEEQIHFTTLFTKISYLCLKYKISKRLIFFAHLHRKQIELLDESNATKEKYVVAKFVLIGFIKDMVDEPIPAKIKKIWEQPPYKKQKQSKATESLDFARVHIFKFEAEQDLLIGINELVPEQEISVKLNELGKNDDYNSLLRFLTRRKKFPFTLHLEQVEILANGVYIPNRLVYEPDYLVDITTVSECFKPNESNPLFYFIKKFFPVFQNKYLIIGNTANYFLDEIFNNPKVEFGTLLKNTFRLSPLGFSSMSDNELKEVVSTLKNHFYTIKNVVTEKFKIHEIYQSNSFLEPSFYAPKYGIQGRLDLYSANKDENEAKIIELKSGKPYKANSYGLNINHYVQTLLYDLTVQASSDEKLKISSFILYSGQPQDALRFAPPLRIQQKEAIKLRNQLVEIDYLLGDVDIENESIFNYIHRDYIKSDGFVKRDIEVFQEAYRTVSDLGKKYFNAFTAFVAREQILAKTGEFGLDKSSGLAGLWLDDMSEKIANFRVLNALDIETINVEKDNTNIVFKRSEKTAPNANFRKGDLGVLYPYNKGNLSVIKNQIFKCSIVELDHEHVHVRLRNKQNNISVFDKAFQWHIEHDHLDHGFNYMYQDLFRFISSDKDYQELILARKAPLKPDAIDIEIPQGMTVEQGAILKDMIAAKEYYLLWGPPGTGKTSVMLHHYIKHCFENTNTKILVLAYTNKAVDEICDAVVRIGDGIRDSFLRIGSRYSTNPNYTDQLLVTKLEEIDNRKDLLTLLNSSRIIVSTLASIHGKKELFSMLDINTIIVDEASQILEPQLCGLLSYAKKFILIGDHNQLPAIVKQRQDESEVKDEQLRTIGLIDRRNSLFERLYKRGAERKWTWTTGRLTQQGRMHVKLMGFANEHFYKGMLKPIKGLEALVAKGPYFSKLPPDASYIATERMVYIPSSVDESSINFKTNIDEAQKAALAVKHLIQLLKYNELPVGPMTIGVITPYRAQISAINSELYKLNVQNLVSVDTVERYQGGARDFIIISLCLNIKSQIKRLVNLSTDGVDRKLNVAMTRARQQVIIIGNKKLMRHNEVYGSLIDVAQEFEMDVN